MASAEDFLSKIPVLGALFGAESDEHKDLQRQFQQMADTYRRFGATALQGRKDQAASQLGMFSPVQQYMSAMMPGVTPFDVQGALQRFNQLQPPPEPAPPRPPSFAGKALFGPRGIGLGPIQPPVGGVDPSTLVNPPPSAAAMLMRRKYTPGLALLGMK
jgi:hypothetical protein